MRKILQRRATLVLNEEDIRDYLVRRHGVTPTYAQNLLDDNLDDKPSTSTVIAL